MIVTVMSFKVKYRFSTVSMQTDYDRAVGSACPEGTKPPGPPWSHTISVHRGARIMRRGRQSRTFADRGGTWVPRPATFDLQHQRPAQGAPAGLAFIVLQLSRMAPGNVAFHPQLLSAEPVLPYIRRRLVSTTATSSEIATPATQADHP